MLLTINDRILPDHSMALKVRVTEFYMDPKLFFKVSFRVYKYLDKSIATILKKGKRKEGSADVLLTIVIDTKKIKKIRIDRRVRYGLKNEYKQVVYLPYNEIEKCREFLYCFIDNITDALLIILTEYGVSRELLTRFKEKALNEIPNNGTYQYEDEDLS